MMKMFYLTAWAHLVA